MAVVDRSAPSVEWQAHYVVPRLAGSHEHRGAVVVSLGDNISEVLATDIGKTKDHALNSLCRRSPRLPLDGHLTWRLRYVETTRHPADRDSRLAGRGLPGRGQSSLGERVRAVLSCADASGPQPNQTFLVSARPRSKAVLEHFGGCLRWTAAEAAAGLRFALPFEGSLVFVWPLFPPTRCGSGARHRRRRVTARRDTVGPAPQIGKHRLGKRRRKGRPFSTDGNAEQQARATSQAPAQ